MSTMQEALVFDDPLTIALHHQDCFTDEFLAYLPHNLHVFDAFEREALSVLRAGFKHYSARTIIEVLRHRSSLAETPAAGWKLNDWHTPYLARLFLLRHPSHAGLFEFRATKAGHRRPTLELRP